MKRTIVALSRRVFIPLTVAASLVVAASCGDATTEPEVIALKPLRPAGTAIASCTVWPGAVTLKGVGFLRPETGKEDDLFLGPREMNKVLHGDVVLGRICGDS